MKFIPIMEISSQIMTLIDETQKELIIVSPYINIKTWSKLKKCLQRAKDRDINITIYARKNVDQDLSDLIRYNVNLVLIKDLHAKIYLNESYAIVSSQNMIEYSDDNSIDFAYSTETEIERLQLEKLVNQYLKIQDSNKESKNNLKQIINENEKTSNQEIIIKEFLKNYEIEKICEAFVKNNIEARTNGSSSYVYCKKIFFFGDAMFREGYEIRFNHSNFEFISIIKVLDNETFSNLNYKYVTKYRTKNNYPESLIFIPQDYNNIEKLIEDYTAMTKIILDKTSKFNLKLAN